MHANENASGVEGFGLYRGFREVGSIAVSFREGIKGKKCVNLL